MFSYQTFGTCSQKIQFDVDDNGFIHNLQFLGGCKGNLQGVTRLVEGRHIDEVESLLKGVICRNETSCPDQLSRAITAYKNSVKTN